MRTSLRILAGLAVLLALLFVGVGIGLRVWSGTDDFRARVDREATLALGLPVRLGAVSVDWLPVPGVAVDQVVVQSRPAVTVERVELRPVWMALLSGRFEIATLVVRQAVVPQAGVDAIQAAMQRKRRAQGGGARAPEGGASPPLPRRALLEQVTWIDAKGQAITVDAQARLDDDGLPRDATLAITRGRLAGTRARLQRQSAHWDLRADIGGGSIVGKFTVAPAKGGGHLLQGDFDTANVEVSALTAPTRTLTGRLEARTQLSSEFRTLGAMAGALQSQTRFTVHTAVIHGFDLAQAVKTVGLSRGGETQLDTLAGQVTTRGQAVQLSNLVASSGVLAATGNVALAPDKSLSGRLSVDLASSSLGGAVSVPLAVGGTLDAPSVMLTRGAMLGAAVGTVVAPGLGTGAGVTIGDKLGEGLGKLFGK